MSRFRNSPRLSLGSEADGNIDMSIIDAFSSDSIPVPLVTLEAPDFYRRILSPHGTLVMNITNRKIDLAPVLAELTEQLGLEGRISRYRPTPEERASSALSAMWVVITGAGDTASLDSVPGWETLRLVPDTRPWTDDDSTIVGALRWW